MEMIDILRHDCQQLAHLFQLFNGHVGLVWRRIFYGFIHFRTHLPVLFAGSFARYKILKIEIGRVIFLPDPSRASEIRNTGISAESGPRKNQYFFAGPDEFRASSIWVAHEKLLFSSLNEAG